MPKKSLGRGYNFQLTNTCVRGIDRLMIEMDVKSPGIFQIDAFEIEKIG